ncbi:MAG: hypothetical protein AABY91_00485 [Gemmatimonadota bacterium]
MPRRIRATLLVLLLGVPVHLSAQEPTPTTATVALKVFLDCEPYYCDPDFFRTEITWVNWVRDRTDAEIQLLVTTQTTGSGGREYTLRFLGLGAQATHQDELRHSSSATATEDDRRQGLVRMVKLGLAPFAARAGAVDLQVNSAGRPAGGAGVPQPDDPWNYWVFRVSGNGYFNGETRSNSASLYGSLRATRTTDLWKLRFELEGSRSTSHFEFDSGDSFDSKLISAGASALAVRSLGDHWSVGVNLSARRSDNENMELAVRGAPGLEFNVFPYHESTTRQLTFLYEIGVSGFQYQDTTIFDKVSETRPNQSLTASLVTKQPWGSTNLSLSGGNNLDDWSQNRVTLFGSLNIRVVKGLQANFFGSYSRLRDQLYLPKGGATDEEVLLRLRQLQTSYRYFVSVGLSYTFGSIFNNIVNPRFGGGGDQVFFF